MPFAALLEIFDQATTAPAVGVAMAGQASCAYR